jgi:hypothetical protein
MGAPVEMEFAVSLSAPPGTPREFGILQVRRMVLARESQVLNVDDVSPADLICRSSSVLGNGVLEDIYDVVMVDVDRFERPRSREVATEIGHMNEKLLSKKQPYLLIGVGRWGTLDPWLGIPVKYDQICGARVIIETGLRDIAVHPSQGSHFFQNITSFMVGYFTVHSDGFIDWDWLRQQVAEEEMRYIKHVHFNKPMIVRMNGHSNKGIILKPQL